MKKLVVKADDACAVIGGRAIVLCDGESGEMLPMLKSCTLAFNAGDLPQVTVTFAVDGEDVRMEI